ncbi:MAG TPA: T9SS type A sorting domain-containing protein, partial [bacterium]|nr:T9SS type A sorting domain-containing protein [bacterium]
ENVKILQGSTLKGHYSSIPSALANAGSGQTVVAASGTHSVSANTTVASGVTLQINGGANINFSGSYKLMVYGSLAISGSAEQHVTIDGKSYSRTGYGDAMILVIQTGSANIQYTDFKNAAYQLTFWQNSGSGAVENCTFTNFGYTTDSKAVSAYYSTGAVIISNSTFTGSGSKGMGVYAINTGTNVTISGNSFNNCRVGIRCYSSDAFLTGNTIQNSYYYGIQSDNVTDDAEYRDNSISGNTSSYGVYLNSSSPYLMYNFIHECKVLINSGSPEFATPYSEGLGHRGYNTITNASAPLIKVQNYSSPFLGYYGGDWEDGGYNSIYETDLPHIYAVNHSFVMADNNYWGSEGPANMADGTSTISDENPLQSNPNPLYKRVASDGYILNSTNQFNKDTNSLNNPIDEQAFKNAVASGFKSDYIMAKEILKRLVDNNSTSKYPPLAIVMYHYFTKKELADEESTRDEQIVKGELTSLLNELINRANDDRLRPFGFKFCALENVLDRNYDGMITCYDQIINDYPNSIHELNGLYDKIVYYVEIQNDFDTAKKLLSRMDDAYPEDELTRHAHILMGEDVNLHKPGQPQQPQTTAETPLEFKLKPAVPNPFNSITTIAYQLPESGYVELSIYTVLGQKVATLVSEKQPAGTYNVVWNASNFANGVYLYRLQTDNGLQITKKLILLK